MIFEPLFKYLPYFFGVYPMEGKKRFRVVRIVGDTLFEPCHIVPSATFISGIPEDSFQLEPHRMMQSFALGVRYRHAAIHIPDALKL